jgi:hypothetical protein
LWATSRWIRVQRDSAMVIELCLYSPEQPAKFTPQVYLSVSEMCKCLVSLNDCFTMNYVCTALNKQSFRLTRHLYISDTDSYTWGENFAGCSGLSRSNPPLDRERSSTVSMIKWIMSEFTSEKLNIKYKSKWALKFVVNKDCDYWKCRQIMLYSWMWLTINIQ